jgi:hypothetical protein
VKEIAIDTNVFVQPTNPNDQYYSDSTALLHWLREGDALLCVDPEFSADEARNRSVIVSEYLAHLHLGMVGYAILAELFATGRVKGVPKRVPQQYKKRIEQLVPDTTDRVFAKVAYNTKAKVLASNDLTDFYWDARHAIKKLGVQILLAGELTAALTPSSPPAPLP